MRSEAKHGIHCKADLHHEEELLEERERNLRRKSDYTKIHGHIRTRQEFHPHRVQDQNKRKGPERRRLAEPDTQRRRLKPCKTRIHVQNAGPPPMVSTSPLGNRIWPPSTMREDFRASSGRVTRTVSASFR